MYLSFYLWQKHMVCFYGFPLTSTLGKWIFLLFYLQQSETQRKVFKTIEEVKKEANN